jgi:hypothetical protein
MDRHGATRRLNAMVLTTPPCSTPASTYATCRSRLATLTRERRCATTVPGRSWTGTPTTSWPRSWPQAHSGSTPGPSPESVAVDPDTPAPGLRPRPAVARRRLRPPVRRWMVSNQTGGQLRVSQVAELPQLLRGTAVLEHDLVHLENIDLTETKSIQSSAHVLDELGQIGLVILRDSRLGDVPLRLARHSTNATRAADGRARYAA